MDGIQAGRKDFAASLAGLQFIPASYVEELDSAPARHTDLNEFSGNARVVKAAICAGEP